MPCFKPKLAWVPPVALEEDIFIRKSDGLRVVPKRRILFRAPIGEYRRLEYRLVHIPCGRCLGCRERDARSWSIRLTCEAQLHAESCFLTLTYAPQHLPSDWSLSKREMQLFIKKLRNAFPDKKLRYFLCGEYSPPPNNRPHYHICLFGEGFYADRKPAGHSKGGHEMFSSATLDQIWGNGRCIVQTLNSSSAAYCARYTAAKLHPDCRRTHTFPDGDIVDIEPEFLLMSGKPGIGGLWISKFHADVYRGDEGAYIDRGGVATLPPRYYDKWLETHKPDQFAAVMARRDAEAHCLEAIQEFAPTRLRVRETVLEARHAHQRVPRDGV